MNKIIKCAKFLFFATMLISSVELSARNITRPFKDKNIEKSTIYADVGLGAIESLPSFGIGYRYQHNYHGLDLNARLLTAFGLVDMNIIQSNLLYNLYFNPKIESQYYMGLGAGCDYIFSNRNNYFKSKNLKENLLLSPEITLGRSYTNQSGSERFFQMQFNFPFYDVAFNKPGFFPPLPFLLITYGMGF
jgi:hypothetical protein